MRVRSPRTLTVSVTAEDIAKGERGDATSCAIARAVKREAGFSEVRVSDERIVRVGSRYDYQYVPEAGSAGAMTAFISNFDEGLYVEPTTFEFKLTHFRDLEASTFRWMPVDA